MFVDGKFLDSDDLKPVSGEIDTDSGPDPRDTLKDLAVPIEYMETGKIVKASRDDVRASERMGSDKQLGVSLVISEDLVEEPGGPNSEPRTDKMNEKEQGIVRDEIERKIFKRGVRDLREVVSIIKACMPIGVRKPEILDNDASRGVCIVKDDFPDTEMVVSVIISGMDCKIFVEEDGVKMYASIGPKYILYCS